MSTKKSSIINIYPVPKSYWMKGEKKIEIKQFPTNLFNRNIIFNIDSVDSSEQIVPWKYYETENGQKIFIDLVTNIIGVKDEDDNKYLPFILDLCNIHDDTEEGENIILNIDTSRDWKVIYLSSDKITNLSQKEMKPVYNVNVLVSTNSTDKNKCYWAKKIDHLWELTTEDYENTKEKISEELNEKVLKEGTYKIVFRDGEWEKKFDISFRISWGSYNLLFGFKEKTSPKYMNSEIYIAGDLIYLIATRFKLLWKKKIKE